MDKVRFLKVYGNLPINIRSEVILVLKDCGPITWNVAFIEINNDTKLGKIMFDKLVKLELI